MLLRSCDGDNRKAKQVQYGEHSYALSDVHKPNVSASRSVTDCKNRSQPTVSSEY
jgi:hypothetical protein